MTASAGTVAFPNSDTLSPLGIYARANNTAQRSGDLDALTNLLSAYADGNPTQFARWAGALWEQIVDNDQDLLFWAIGCDPSEFEDQPDIRDAIGRLAAKWERAS